MAFRLNRMDVFLTYSRVPKNFTSELVLREISKKAEVEKYVISVEKHKEGGRRPCHIHAYFKFKNKLDVKNPEFFDITYYGVKHHPNIQPPKRKDLVIRYVKKDGNFIENYDSRPEWLKLIEDYGNDKKQFLKEIMYSIGRIDNYAGYRTLRDLYDLVNTPDNALSFLKPSKK